jgi:hypothetical protein
MFCVNIWKPYLRNLCDVSILFLIILLPKIILKVFILTVSRTSFSLNKFYCFKITEIKYFISH